MRLLEVILTLEQGGAQSLLLEKSRALQAKGFFVLVAAFEDGASRAAFEAANIPVILLRPKRFPALILPLFLLEIWRIYRELCQIIRTHQIDIVQGHLLSIYDFLLPFLPVKARLWTFHNTEFEIRRYDRLGLKTWLYRWLYPLFAKRINAIIAVSHSVKNALQKDFGFPNITVIENAIPVAAFRIPANRDTFCAAEAIPADAKIILTVGRLTEQKGQRYLLEAFALLQRQHPNCYLCIVGTGELDTELKALAGANVRFLSLRQDIPEILAIADIFVLPSLWEGLSQALLEAMAARKAIVATDISSQLIQDGINGKLVPPRDSMALFQAMLELLNPAEAERLAKVAYETVRSRHDISQLAETYTSLYQSLIGAS